ncbi:hypothetical protein M0811_01134 [Anaeramoeba ignava]|uniref:THH1/TOM1/TOM3 domain-containing protein n=1 Tax=Anaeramoeba ignava TaxID=1746090 RepID=A0A9Q0RCF5_ANAIG|nr:hypothetical protein M0811_01134 [Anaeramoeba ignava]
MATREEIAIFSVLAILYFILLGFCFLKLWLLLTRQLSQILLSAFFMLIFTLKQHHAWLKRKDETHETSRKAIILFVGLDSLVYVVQIIFNIEVEGGSFYFTASVYLVCAVSLLIFSFILMRLLKNKQQAMNLVSLKKTSIVILICTFLYFVRIIILISVDIYLDDISSNTVAIIQIFYSLFFDMLPITLIAFVLFVTPPKTEDFVPVVTKSIQKSLLENKDKDWVEKQEAITTSSSD